MRSVLPEPPPRLRPDERGAVEAALRAAEWSRSGDDWPLPCLDRLEEEWAARHGTSHAVAVSSGTAGLTLALRALPAPPGDEVLIPAYGCPAVDVAVLAAGLTPIHVDLDPSTYCLSPSAAAAQVTPRTAAIVAVHFAGQPARLRNLLTVAERHGIALIEDACLAPGAAYDGKPAGGWGRLGVFSFGVRKPVSAGEGGIVTTNDAALARRLRESRSFGSDPDTGEIAIPTGNFRLAETAAALVLPQFARLEEDRTHRQVVVDRLLRALDGSPYLRALDQDPRAVSAHAQLWLRWDELLSGISRGRFVEAVQAEGIPLFPGWERPSSTLAFYNATRASEWLRERNSGRDPLHYEQSAYPAAENAAYNEAMLLDFPLLQSGENVIADIEWALRKVLAGMDELQAN